MDEQEDATFSDVFEHAAVGLLLFGPDGIILNANQSELELLGYQRQEYVGRHITETGRPGRSVPNNCKRGGKVRLGETSTAEPLDQMLAGLAVLLVDDDEDGREILEEFSAMRALA